MARYKDIKIRAAMVAVCLKRHFAKEPSEIIYWPNLPMFGRLVVSPPEKWSIPSCMLFL